MTSTTSTSSAVQTIKTATARHRNFLVGQKDSHSSLMGASELERIFPDRNIDIFVGTYNLGEMKTIPKKLEDLVLPEDVEFVPSIIVINTQENGLDRTQWEITLQETIGTNHVLYHSAQHGLLHVGVFMKRELIWYCSVPEDDTVTVRAVKQIKTKGCIAISFTLFGTSMLFVGCHFNAHEGNAKGRIDNFNSINTGLRLPRAVVDNPLQKPDAEVSKRFDCIFWAGDMNFRITKDRDIMLRLIESKRQMEHPGYEELLESDELTQFINEGKIFQNYQEGRISFAPTYKFDIGMPSCKLKYNNILNQVIDQCCS